MDLKTVLILTFVTLAKAIQDLSIYPGEECYRNCDNAVARICYFKWTLEQYHVMGPACGNCSRAGSPVREDCYAQQCVSADGVERGFMSINRKLPGPSIHVCQNDKIVVDVVNNMGGQAVTIHWHGFQMRKTPWMDGVPYLTQCPIPFSSTFRYQFPVKEFGTMWYHSHTGMHKVNGIHGGLVIRQPRANSPNAQYYDYDLKEHLIVISDWMKVAVEQFSPGLTNTRLQPSNLLINGKGTVMVNGLATTPTPLEVFRVQKGKRYRFRLVNTLNHPCPVVLEIERHNLTVIATDSYDIKPVTVTSLVSQAGERYDFVVEANQNVGEFWMRVKGFSVCDPWETQQLAVLSYSPPSVPTASLAYPQKKFPLYNQEILRAPIKFLNHPLTECYSSNRTDLCITDLVSYLSQPDVTDVKPDQQFFLGFDLTVQPNEALFNQGTYKSFTDHGNGLRSIGAINNISMALPSVSLLTQPQDVTDAMFCDENNLPASCAGVSPCKCIHRIKLKLNSVVELVIVDESPVVRTLIHPFHIHGLQAFVIGVGTNDDPRPMSITRAATMRAARQFITPVSRNYVLKDTVSIPSKGFTILRFRADNPGYWFMHCHYAWHTATGMSMVVQVGEPSDMVPAPPNFPKCGSFMPELMNFDTVNKPLRAGKNFEPTDEEIEVEPIDEQVDEVAIDEEPTEHATEVPIDF